MSRPLHVVGAGIAGLACALQAARSGRLVIVHEASAQPGGRCRSFHDARLDRTIDNGSHLILGANRAVLAFLAETGGIEDMEEIAPAALPFHDLARGRTWTLHPNAGPVAWWIFSERRRLPETAAADYLAALRLPLGGTVERRLGDHPLFETLWRPLCVAALNAEPGAASARLFGRVLAETLLRGERTCRPWVSRRGLSAALVEPAVARLREHGGKIRFRRRLLGLEDDGARVTHLRFDGERVAVGAADVVLAVPATALPTLLPGVSVPPPGATIVNAHFRLDRPASLPGGLPFLGLIGGEAEWLFVRDDVLSVTVSAADRLTQAPVDEIAARLWADAARTLGRSESPVPPFRVVKERRATIAQDPASLRLRPSARTRYRNLFLAGDFTATGLPATLEGAVRSGLRAARLAEKACG